MRTHSPVRLTTEAALALATLIAFAVMGVMTVVTVDGPAQGRPMPDPAQSTATTSDP